jgi:hypothetical protein
MPPSDPSATSLTRDFRRAENFVRDARTLLLPKGWNDWCDGLPPPEHRLSVDQKWAPLARSRRRVLTPSEVRARHPQIYWPSHEVAIRLQLAWYTEVEFQNRITYAANKAVDARRRLHRLRAREKFLAKYLRLTPMDSEIQSTVELLQKASVKVSAELHAIHPPEGGKPGQSWKAGFVFRLAGFCYIITGEQSSPSTNSAFAALVRAAWNSLHPNIPLIDWDSYVHRFARSASLEEALETALITSFYAHGIWRH